MARRKRSNRSRSATKPDRPAQRRRKPPARAGRTATSAGRNKKKPQAKKQESNTASPRAAWFAATSVAAAMVGWSLALVVIAVGGFLADLVLARQAASVSAWARGGEAGRLLRADVVASALCAFFAALAIGVRVPRRLALWILPRLRPPVTGGRRTGHRPRTAGAGSPELPFQWNVLAILALALGVATLLLPLWLRALSLVHATLVAQFVWSRPSLFVLLAGLGLLAFAPLAPLQGAVLARLHRMEGGGHPWSVGVSGWCLVGAAIGAMVGLRLERSTAGVLGLFAAALGPLAVSLLAIPWGAVEEGAAPPRGQHASWTPPRRARKPAALRWALRAATFSLVLLTVTLAASPGSWSIIVVLGGSGIGVLLGGVLGQSDRDSLRACAGGLLVALLGVGLGLLISLDVAGNIAVRLVFVFLACVGVGFGSGLVLAGRLARVVDPASLALQAVSHGLALAFLVVPLLHFVPVEASRLGLFAAGLSLLAVVIWLAASPVRRGGSRFIGLGSS